LIISLIKKFTLKKLIFRIKERYQEYIISQQLDKALKEERVKEYRTKLIKLALLKTKSTNKNEKLLGILQLTELDPSGNTTYDAIIEALKNENDKEFQKYLIDALYKINKQ